MKGFALLMPEQEVFDIAELGTLVVIGGAEDKKHECTILKEVLQLAGGREARLCVVTTATELPVKAGEQYRSLFHDLGAKSVSVLTIAHRPNAHDPAYMRELSQCSGIFFVGGDQLRLTSILGGTPVDQAIHRTYQNGGVLAGTSAGASVMSDTMILDGSGDDSPRKDMLTMAHGMGLLKNVVIDQHFAQRGRINRLLAAVAQNPYVLGVGIDEDTAIVVGPHNRFHVVGSQTVTVIDGTHMTYSNVSELEPSETLALMDVVLHILPAGYEFDFDARRPLTKLQK